MSIGSIYEAAYKGDYNQVKIKLGDVLLSPDEVSLTSHHISSLNNPLLDLGLYLE